MSSSVSFCDPAAGPARKATGSERPGGRRLAFSAEEEDAFLSMASRTFSTQSAFSTGDGGAVAIAVLSAGDGGGLSGGNSCKF